MEEPRSAPEPPATTFKKRVAKSKSTVRKRAASPSPAPDSASDSMYSGDEEGRQIKRPKKSGGVVAKSAAPGGHSLSETQVSTTTTTTITSTDATKSSNWFDENDGDLKAKNPSDSVRTQPFASTEPDGHYRGQANYKSFIQKKPDAPSQQVGPVRSSTNVRTITVTDFAPDVCKDYKQTGFCGFGDNCKYLHAREDYKQGWELDRDWEIGTKGKRIRGKTVASANRSIQGGNEDEIDDALVESIPFACIICKKPYQHPVVTKCGHYFCESCALQRYRKNPSCAACGAGTGGVFNVAKKLSKLLEKKRERVRKRKELALADGQEVSGSDDDDDND